MRRIEAIRAMEDISKLKFRAEEMGMGSREFERFGLYVIRAYRQDELGIIHKRIKWMTPQLMRLTNDLIKNRGMNTSVYAHKEKEVIRVMARAEVEVNGRVIRADREIATTVLPEEILEYEKNWGQGDPTWGKEDELREIYRI